MTASVPAGNGHSHDYLRPEGMLNDHPLSRSTQGRLTSPFEDPSTGLLWLLDTATYAGDLREYLRLVTQKYQEHKAKQPDRGNYAEYTFVLR